MSDLISRAELLKRIWEHAAEHPNAYHLTNYADLLVSEAPSVDAAPVVHAKWVENNDGTHFCGECGIDAPWTANDGYGATEVLRNYCPNCGAKMDGGK